jgi:hypothetical protein
MPVDTVYKKKEEEIETIDQRAYRRVDKHDHEAQKEMRQTL